MNNLEKIYDNAVDAYNRLADLTEKIYDSLFEKEKCLVNIKDVRNNFDFYIQHLLLHIALADDSLAGLELDFIKKIVRYKDSLANYKVKKIQDLFLQRDQINEECENALKEVPYFIQLACIADSKSVDNGDFSFSEICLQYLVKIITCLTKIDLNIDKSEAVAGVNDLQPIINYIVKK